ncbi:XisI protein [Chloroflexi bacterium TSY]|nr:XisI protein [Chloroflexi bacterium TSY]
MDRITPDRYSEIIEQILTEYAAVPYAYSNIQTETVFDRAKNRYLLVNVGWEGDKQIHSCLVHIDIIDDKIWILRDGTEDGIAEDLEQAKIPKTQIVLGFHPPELRQYTDYAVA